MPPKREYFPSPDRDEQQQPAAAAAAAARRPAPKVARPRGSTAAGQQPPPPQQHMNKAFMMRSEAARRNSPAKEGAAPSQNGGGTEPQRYPSAPRRSPSATFGRSGRFVEQTIDGFTLVPSRTPSPGPLKYDVAKHYEMKHQHHNGGVIDKSERFFFPSPVKAKNEGKHADDSAAVAAAAGTAPATARSASAAPPLTSPRPNTSTGGTAAAAARPASARSTTPSKRASAVAVGDVSMNKAAQLRREYTASTPPASSRDNHFISTRSSSNSKAHRDMQPMSLGSPRPVCETAAEVRARNVAAAGGNTNGDSSLLLSEEQLRNAPTLPSWTGNDGGGEFDRRNHYSKAPAVRDFSNTASPYQRIPTSSSRGGNGNRSHTPSAAPREQQPPQPQQPQHIVITPRGGDARQTAAAASARTPKQQQTPGGTLAASSARSGSREHARASPTTRVGTNTMSRQRRFSMSDNFHDLEDFFQTWLSDAKRRGAF